MRSEEPEQGEDGVELVAGKLPAHITPASREWSSQSVLTPPQSTMVTHSPISLSPPSQFTSSSHTLTPAPPPP